MQKILVVDADIDSTLTIRKILRDNYECTYLLSAESAFRYLIQKSPDIIILSDGIPDMDSLTFIGTLRENNIQCPIIFIGDISQKKLSKYLRVGIQDIIPAIKPRPAAFEVALKQALERINAKQHLDLAEKSLEEKNLILHQAIDGAIATIAIISDLRDFYTDGHQQQTAKMAAIIGEIIGLSEHQNKGLYYAGLVHDIGKISIPIEILCSSRRLLAEEVSIIKRHSITGYEILKNIEFPWNIASAVLQHHERCDGSGYPHALTEESICLEAKILAIADVIEAMSSMRPYRCAYSFEDVLIEMQQGKGTKYDKRILDKVLENVDVVKRFILALKRE